MIELFSVAFWPTPSPKLRMLMQFSFTFPISTLQIMICQSIDIRTNCGSFWHSSRHWLKCIGGEQLFNKVTFDIWWNVSILFSKNIQFSKVNFNMTMSTRRDSDIVLYYGQVLPLISQSHNGIVKHCYYEIVYDCSWFRLRNGQV